MKEKEKKAPDIDEMDGEDEQEDTDNANYFFEEEKLFDKDLDLTGNVDDLIDKYGSNYSKSKLGTKDPFDPRNWSF